LKHTICILIGLITKRADKPLRIEAFGFGNEPIQIYYIKPYKAGFKYYSPVDYQGGLQDAELEEEISNYHLNKYNEWTCSVNVD
jgi:hypothetical protein